MVKIEMSDFDVFVKAHNAIEECIKKLDDAYLKTNHQFNDGSEQYFHNPFEYGSRNEVKTALHTVETDITDFIISQMNKKFTNLSIDRDDVNSFVFGDRWNNIEHVRKFNPHAIVRYINNKYINEEDETLKQLKENAKSCIKSFFGKWWFSAIESFDDFILFGKTGLELEHSGYERGTLSLLKLIEIELCNIKPSRAQEFYVNVGSGLNPGYVKQVKAFKNGKLKITFNSVEDRTKIINMLFDIVK